MKWVSFTIRTMTTFLIKKVRTCSICLFLYCVDRIALIVCAARSNHLLARTDRQCGPRMLTFFIYLSDVEAGGGTDFPILGLTVMPKRGSAVLWPSVYDSNPLIMDGRTKHQALPVEAGTKFAANAWIHTFDYVSPQEKGCN
jgi:hypothetical protein